MGPGADIRAGIAIVNLPDVLKQTGHCSTLLGTNELNILAVDRTDSP